MDRPEQQRGQGGTERQRVERRDDRRNGNRQRELAEELAGDAADKGARDEHALKHQSHGHHRAGHLFHRLVGCLLRLEAVFDVMLDRLHDDNGIIDDNTDRQYQSEQRQVVEREADGGHDREGADHGDGNGGQRNECRAPALQEDQHHDGDEDDGFNQRVQNAPNRFLHKRSNIVADNIRHVIGKLLLQLRHPLLDPLGGGDGVGIRQLKNGEAGGLMAIDLAGGVPVACPQLDAADVLDAHLAAVVAAAQDDVAELLRLGQPAQGVNGQLEWLAGRCRRLTEMADRELHVLFADRSQHVAGREVQRGQRDRGPPKPSCCSPARRS